MSGLAPTPDGRRLLCAAWAETLDGLARDGLALEGAERLVEAGIGLALDPIASRPDDRMARRRTHDRLLSVWRRGPALPGGPQAVFADADAALRWLRAEAPALRAALARLAGRGEFVATLSERALAAMDFGSPDDAPAQRRSAPSASPGAAYLRARAGAIADLERDRARRASIAAAFARRLAPTAPFAVRACGPSASVDISILAPRGAGETLRRRLRDWRPRLARDGSDEIALTGPWPPYGLADRLLSPAARRAA